MITEKEIIEILNSYSDYVDRSRTEQVVSEINFELVAKEIIEKGEQFSCLLPDSRCDRHKIDDEEGCWEFCNTCKREWAR